MKKFPIFATFLLIAGVLASLAFTHPISSQNGVVRDYSLGRSLTLDTASGPHTYLLRASTLMWGWGSTGFITSTGGSASSSGSSSSSSSTSSSTTATGTATAAASPTPAATATTTGGTGGTGSSTGTTSGSTNSTTTTGAASNVNGLGSGSRVTVFAECFPGSAFRHMNSAGLTGKGEKHGQNNVCFALAVIVRSPMAGTIAATGGNAAGTTTAAMGATTETPGVTVTPTP